MGAQKDDPGEWRYDQEAFDSEGPVHEVTLSPYRIDRYPVTVAAFERFIKDRENGYLVERFWDPSGWSWRKKEQRTQPDDWDQQLRHPNRPVVGISWYEADAFARWAGKRLPTEAEWEFAARGPAGRTYPWGEDKPEERCANFGSRVRVPSPVGVYPAGATPERVFDLAGNVWEWCAGWYGPYPKGPVMDPPGLDSGGLPPFRGGAFVDGPGDLRAAGRPYGRPVGSNDDVGFRCVVSEAGGQV